MLGVQREVSLAPEDQCLFAGWGAAPLSKSSQSLLPETQGN